jgi:hypothetical protein
MFEVLEGNQLEEAKRLLGLGQGCTHYMPDEEAVREDDK